MIDLSPMKLVRVDPDVKIARVEPGVVLKGQQRSLTTLPNSQFTFPFRRSIGRRMQRLQHESYSRKIADRLEALDLIRVDESGYRLALSFQTTSERRDPVVPTVLEENQTLLDAADAFLEILLPPARYGDPDDPLGGVLFWLPDPSQLLDHPRVGPWLRLAAALTATESPENNRAVQMGPPLKQQALCA